MRNILLIGIFCFNLFAEELTYKQYLHLLQTAKLEEETARLKIGELMVMAQKKRNTNDSLGHEAEALYISMLDTLRETHASNQAYSIKIQKTIDHVTSLSSTYKNDKPNWAIELQLDQEDFQMLQARPLAILPRHQKSLTKLAEIIQVSETALNGLETRVSDKHVHPTQAPMKPTQQPKPIPNKPVENLEVKPSPTNPTATLQENDTQPIENNPLSEKLSPKKFTTYTVKGTETLWAISSLPEVYNTPYRWAEIYFANKDKISNPDLLVKGMILTIPR